MSFLLRKVVRPWNSAKEAPKSHIPDAPMPPPSPDISHLTRDEVAAICEVIRRQEEFERQEGNRVRKLREELNSLQQWLTKKSGADSKDSKQVNRHHCHFCFKRKLSDGLGKVCNDCQQRVCHRCGTFSRSRWSAKRNKNEGRWRCKLCIARRDVQCLTGEWYHGVTDSSEHLKKKLLGTSTTDIETEQRCNMQFQRKHGDGKVSQPYHLSRKLSYSNSAESQHAQTPATQNKHQQSNTSHSGHRDERVTSGIGYNEDVVESSDNESQNMLMLERRVSRQLQKERRQKRRKKTEVRKNITADENEGNYADTSDIDHSNVSSSHDGPEEHTMSFPTVPTSLKALESDTVTWPSVKESERDLCLLDVESEKPHESPAVHISTGQLIQELPAKKPPEVCTEKTLQTWWQSGFPSASQIVLKPLGASCQFGIKVVGGVQDQQMVSRAIVSWVSSWVKTSIYAGQEILEWNGQILRGQTYDYVVSETSCECPQAVLIVNSAEGREESQPSHCRPAVSIQVQPAFRTQKLQGNERRRRTLPRIPNEVKQVTDHVRSEVQLKLFYEPSKSSLSVTVLRAKNIVSAKNEQFALRSLYAILALAPGKSARSYMETEHQDSLSDAEWNQTFSLSGISLTELASRALYLTVWTHVDFYDSFIGEILLDLSQARLDNQPQWYDLEEHDENGPVLPHKSSHSVITAGGSCKQSATKTSKLSLDIFSKLRIGFSASTTECSDVLLGASQVGSREFHLNSVSQPDSFTTKVRKKMRQTVSKMSPLSLMEKKDNTDQRKDHLAPPQSPSRTNSTSSFFLSDDEDSLDEQSSSPLTLDRPQPEGDDITSILGPGQIPPRPSAEPTVCGDIKLGFMVSKGQLKMDIVCAASLLRAGKKHPPDTYVKTYLVEGQRVIQRKKTAVVKASLDPVYRQSIIYSAYNVHGRIMKIDIWQRASNFEKKACLGEALVRLDGLDLSKHTMAWYKLFQINSTEYGSDEFLDPW